MKNLKLGPECADLVAGAVASSLLIAKVSLRFISSFVLHKVIQATAASFF
jgi:hypothetical protein